ncbi:hypothetical protein Poli38472_011713 [Pythium oligandrum]|uniref:Uncharacterized protein n=1 Tax=Pythium oligandrum TaxID=41045 RepID=A0A8K1FCB0_PYTOL|nr:hypothetical protein Poli38472_011713 [Pythium oligandrum]|eukprot:TMW58125.1 hypothetical protein Poli38472_011713 [Pythium oligandrum]
MRMEDECVLDFVEHHGPSQWEQVASKLPNRTGKQCRERWHNQLNPLIRRDPWSEEEDLVLIKMQAVHGNAWAKISKVLTGRPDNAIKNRWHTKIKPQLQRLTRRARKRNELKINACLSKNQRLPSSPDCVMALPPHPLTSVESLMLDHELSMATSMFNDETLVDQILLDLCEIQEDPQSFDKSTWWTDESICDL